MILKKPAFEIIHLSDPKRWAKDTGASHDLWLRRCVGVSKVGRGESRLERGGNTETTGKPWGISLGNTIYNTVDISRNVLKPEFNTPGDDWWQLEEYREVDAPKIAPRNLFRKDKVHVGGIWSEFGSR